MYLPLPSPHVEPLAKKQSAKGKQPKHLWFSAQDGKRGANLAIERCPGPDENDGPDGLCLEGRNVSEHSLLREDEPDCLA